jgi:hypothetical protein
MRRLTSAFSQVPPKDNLDRVPLGASSASMYPGYSPADHIYGEAAQEFGERAAELKRQGMDLKLDPNGPEYVVGQNKKPRRLSQEVEPAQSTSISLANAPDDNVQNGQAEPMEGVEQSVSDSQYFVIDSKPTPVAELGEIQKQKNKANDKAKRRVSFKEEQEVAVTKTDGSDAPRSKKVKVTTVEPSARPGSESVVQEEDISAEVEARLEAKEERRKRKEEKKRKRDSEDSLARDQANSAPTSTHGPVETSSTDKPKKKKHKSEANEINSEAEPAANAKEDNKSKKERKKAKKGEMGEQATIGSVTSDNEKPRKKRKKEAAS